MASTLVREATVRVAARVSDRVPAPVRRGAKDQLAVAAGQLLAGAGNLSFSLVAVRLLSPGAYAQLSVFLALYLVVNLPTLSLSAIAALSPDAAPGLRRGLGRLAGVGGGLAALASPWLAPALHLSLLLALALAADVPCAVLLSVGRGRLYGQRHHHRLVASLTAEPVVRLSAGVALTAVAGAGGGAIGVVAGGYLAWAVTGLERRATAGRRHVRPLRLSPPDRATGLAFLLLALLQNIDLLLANRLLPPAQAGQYAVLSSLGGLAAFASATIPLVLLPQAARRQRHALGTALGVGAGLGAAAVAVTAAAPGLVTGALFGGRYAPVAPLAGRYVGAMALFGISRILVAHDCATRRPRTAVLALVAVAGGQTGLILALPRRPEAIATATVAAMATVTAVLVGHEASRRLRGGALHGWAGAVVQRLTRPTVAARNELLCLQARANVALTQPVVAGLAAITAVGVGVRLVVPRGLWLDEATSLFQAKMPFGAMIANLYNTDVHPPLYFSLLWVTERALGTGEMAVRVPSIVFGCLVVPLAYVAGRDLYDRRTGLMAAALATTAPMLVWYAQEARMYSMFMLFGLAAAWSQVMAIRRGRTRDFAFFALSCAALGWTEYFGLLQVATQQLIFVLVCWQRRRLPEGRRLIRGWAWATAATAAALVPVGLFAYHQFLANQASGRGFNLLVSGGAPPQAGNTVASLGRGLSVYVVLANLIWAVGGYHSDPTMAEIAATWPLGMLAAFVLLGRRMGFVTKVLLAVVAGTILLLIVLALFKRPLLDVRYFSGVVPVMVVLAARGITGCARRRWALGLLAGMVLVTCTVGLVDQQLNGSNPRTYDFRGALREIDRQFRPGDLLAYAPGDLHQLVAYYAPHARAEVLAPSTVVPRHGRLFLMTSQRLLGTKTATAQVGTMISRLERRDRLAKEFDQPNVQVWELVRRS
jgi:O-antigen/teichoic acid export membrane protein